MTLLPAHRLARAAGALALAAFALTSASCVKKPTMVLDHAEVSGIRVAFPPSLGVLMTIVVDVTNPNSYDVAVRAVRGQMVLANRYSLPIDFRAQGNGVWLRSNGVTPFGVPVEIPVPLALQLLQDGTFSPTIPYRFTGRADVTATSTFQLEKDDYSVDEQGFVTRQQFAAAIGRSF